MRAKWVSFTGWEYVGVWMSNKHPEPIMFHPESLDSGPLRQVPRSNSLVLAAENTTYACSLGWKTTLDMLLRCPRHDPISYALVLLMRQVLIVLSSAAEMINGNVGWNVAKLTPRSCPSKMYLTIEKLSKASNDPSPVWGVFLAVPYVNCLNV